MARYGNGCILWGGVAPTTYVSFQDTWQWTMVGGWEELVMPPPLPAPRFYHTLNVLSNGDLFMFGPWR